MTIKITACCDKCDASESFTDTARVNPWLDAHTCAPAIPAKPTLGWIDAFGEKTLAVVGIKKPGDSNHERIYVRVARHGGWDRTSEITAFTRATAVPTAALDELREFIAAYPKYSSTVSRFLAAVDEAGQS